MAYARLEPFGGEVEDYRAGLVASTLVNVNRVEGGTALGPGDLIPWKYVAPEPVLSAKEHAEKLAKFFMSRSSTE